MMKVSTDSALATLSAGAIVLDDDLAGDTRRCLRCGDEYCPKRLIDLWRVSGVALVACVDVDMCARRRSQLRLMGLA
jgi:hypothetical protein